MARALRAVRNAESRSMSDATSQADTNTIEGMVEREVAQELRGEAEGLAERIEEARQEVETFVIRNPWTGLFAAALLGAIAALLLG